MPPSHSDTCLHHDQLPLHVQYMYMQRVEMCGKRLEHLSPRNTGLRLWHVQCICMHVHVVSGHMIPLHACVDR